jgi:formylglycine-generating enzyme
MNDDESKCKGCCTPSAGRGAPTSVAKGISHVCDGPSEETLAGMVALPGGTFLMGTDYPDGFPGDGEGPVHAVTIDSFRIDPHPVTNTQFERFISATSYKTEAERFGWSFVFWAHVPRARFRELVKDRVADAPWWCLVPGASWNSPEGPGSEISRRGHHPVVHVSWNDAQAYCVWSGKTLPTEAQWEFAARGGLEQKLYPWGNKLRPGGKHLCNIWQGNFPDEDTAEDGYSTTCPVEAFPANGYGLFSMTGNTWEWCADWFSPESHSQPTNMNPHGPMSGEARVVKGGSFLCHHSYCNRYRVAARTSNTPDSTTGHIGFRCAVNDPSLGV